MNKEYLKNPPKKYRPAPFWSWNEKLNPEETKIQVELMEKAGLGGFFMHARGGLQTNYLKEDWFDNIKAASDKANETGMLAWGYDENGWPSGFGCGAVNGLGVEYQQKYLRCEEADAPKTTERTITNIEIQGKNLHFYYDVNPFYVDVMNKKVIAEFLNSTHEKYIDALGEKLGGMVGFFTDEPQVSRNGYPWSFILEDEYKRAYGESLIENLPALFTEIEGYTVVRYRYWKLVRDLFAAAFNEQIYAWCKEHNQLYTGHMTFEEDFWGHMQCSGSAMPNYEFMDIPGMDHLGRMLAEITTIMQLTSVANQLGKKQILSETFALCGWNVSFEELRWIYESQMVRGVNYLCQHLEGYSLRGIRKRDYPASLYRHQPWWKDYKSFNDMVSRIGMLIAEGDVDYNVLLLHSVESGWLQYNDNDPESQDKTNRNCNILKSVMESLERAQIHYHFGDNKIIERHGSVENGIFKIGTQNYRVVIVPPAECFGKATFDALKEFKNQGGAVVFTEKMPTFIDGEPTDAWKNAFGDCPLVNREDLPNYIPECCKKINLDFEGKDKNTVLSLVRRFEDDKMTMHYLVNPNNEKIHFKATVKGKSGCIFNAATGETAPLCFENKGDEIVITESLEKRGSIVIFVYDEPSEQSAVKEDDSLTPISLKGEWEIALADDNALTLDYCDLYVNGKQTHKNLPVSDVQEILCSYRKKVDAEVVFNFEVKEKTFVNCKLVVETPEIFDIFVNGKLVDKTDLGFLHDPAFRLIDIKDYVELGNNEIKLSCPFVQSEEVYKNMDNALIFESEKNKLTYDIEIEAVYVVGDFAVKTDKEFEHIDRRALRVDGGFYITSAPKTLTDGNIAEQGYPFFAGSMTFKKKINLTADEIKNRSICFKDLCSTVTEVKVNGKSAGKIMWQPYSVDVSDLLVVGENQIEITVTGNLRNLLGPFHLNEGESYWVAPPQFIHNSPLWVGGENKDWVDSYCFVEFGIF
ncbi:MAG: hypothetical protein E7551_01740 [Ruminococcaceae bacterium]|nr:hypothetical protein [Oscillospiraceae bacterium]